MTHPAYYAIDPDTEQASGAVVIFCDEDCRERFQPHIPFKKLASGEADKSGRCATCGEELP